MISEECQNRKIFLNFLNKLSQNKGMEKFFDFELVERSIFMISIINWHAVVTYNRYV
mgnify:FL=1